MRSGLAATNRLYLHSFTKENWVSVLALCIHYLAVLSWWPCGVVSYCNRVARLNPLTYTQLSLYEGRFFQ